MIFGINVESITTCVIIFLIIFLRSIYIIVRNKKKFPSQLFEGKFFILFLMKIIFGLGTCVLALFFSNSFYLIGLFFTWLLVSLSFVSLIFVLWIIFFMHGYDVRYQFKDILVPAPLSVLEFLVILATASFTLNYALIGFSVIYFLIDYRWNYEGYLLTKPKIPDYVFIKEEEEL